LPAIETAATFAPNEPLGLSSIVLTTFCTAVGLGGLLGRTGPAASFAAVLERDEAFHCPDVRLPRLHP
jgi:hypothetical protein